MCTDPLNMMTAYSNYTAAEFSGISNNTRQLYNHLITFHGNDSQQAKPVAISLPGLFRTRDKQKFQSPEQPAICKECTFFKSNFIPIHYYYGRNRLSVIT